MEIAVDLSVAAAWRYLSVATAGECCAACIVPFAHMQENVLALPHRYIIVSVLVCHVGKALASALAMLYSACGRCSPAS